MTVSRDNYAEQNARLSGAAIQRARGSNAGLIEEEPFVATDVNFSATREKFFPPLFPNETNNFDARMTKARRWNVYKVYDI